MKKIITSVGLSLFSNFFDEESKKTAVLKSKVFDPLNKPVLKAVAYNSVLVKSRIDKLRPKVAEYAKGDDNASAEITSIREIIKTITEEEPNEQFEIHLLASDTVLSVLAGVIVEKVLNEKKTGNNKNNP